VVGPQGIVHRRPAAGEFRGIEHDHAEPLPGGHERVELLEGIGRLDGDRRGPVEFRVGPGQGRGPRAPIDGQHAPRGPGDRTGDGEAAGVREHVEHPPAARQPRGCLTVVTLVEVVTRLLSLGQIDPEPQPVLRDEHGTIRGSAAQHAIGEMEPLELRETAFRAAQQDAPRRDEGLERVADDLEAARERQRRHLHGEVGAVPIDDEARQVVPLAVDEAAGS